MKINDYAMFLKKDDMIQAVPVVETHQKLVPGAYKVNYDRRENQVAFQSMALQCDKIVDLPGGEFEEIMEEVDIFLSPEAATRFQKAGLLPKNNILLHGLPGAGKTVIVNRLAEKIVSQQGVVLFNPPPDSISETYRIFDSIQPETLVLVIMEELDSLIRSAGESPFLHFLDGEVQKRNAIYVATTNYLDRIPERIRRPGRFSVVKEVGMPKIEAREFYLKAKLSDPILARLISEKTEGFSIDMLKEVVRLHYCLGKDLDSSVSRVAGRQIPSASDKRAQSDAAVMTLDGTGVSARAGANEQESDYAQPIDMDMFEAAVAEAVRYNMEKYEGSR